MIQSVEIKKSKKTKKTTTTKKEINIEEVENDQG